MNIGKLKLIKKIKEKKKKGFTLVELLAVIVILAVIMVITIPTIIGSMSKAKEKSEEIFIASIERSLNKFIENELVFGEYNFNENKQEYTTKPIEGKNGYEEVVKTHDNLGITIEDFDKLGYYQKEDLINPKTDKKCNVEDFHFYKRLNDSTIYYYKLKLDCIDKILSNLPLIDPDLSTGLIPVYYDKNGVSSDWYVADPNSDWYDYDKQIWANAVSVKNKDKYYDNIKKEYIIYNNEGKPNEINKNDLLAMFVWVPRFSYTIGCHETNKCRGYRLNDGTDNDLGDPSITKPGAIDIKFIYQDDNQEKDSSIKPSYNYTSDNDRIPSNWYTPPAFTFNGKELSGIWVGKFETSGTSAEPKILPNVNSSGNLTIGSQYNSAKNFKNNFSEYGLSSSADSHMMKNSEWAAVAYLSQSIYGKYGNKDYSGVNKEIYNNNFSSYGHLTGVSSGVPNANYVTVTNNICFYDNVKSNGAGTGQCGPGASTTGNVYGIYDMNGGASEYVMANYGNFPGTNTNINSAWFSDLKNIGYYDSYDSYNLIGHAFSETKNWYSDDDYSSPSQYNPWVERGGSATSKEESGIFYYNKGTGASSNSYPSFRVTLISD